MSNEGPLILGHRMEGKWQPMEYRITFLPDGTAEVETDCVRITGVSLDLALGIAASCRGARMMNKPAMPPKTLTLWEEIRELWGEIRDKFQR